MTRFVSWLALPLLAACGSSPPSDTPQPTSGGAESTGSEGSSGGVAPTGVDPSAMPCEKSEDCDDGGVCAAAYDAGLQQPGPGFCVAACIEPKDLARWCVDDSSCCADATCSRVDGFCAPLESGTTTTGGSTGASSSSGEESSTSDTEGTTSSDGSTTGATDR